MKKNKTCGLLVTLLMTTCLMLGGCTEKKADNVNKNTEKTEKKVTLKSHTVKTDKTTFFEVGKDVPSGEYEIKPIDGKKPTIFFVWNTEGNKFISEILGDDDIQSYRINLTDGMEFAVWESEGVELIPTENAYVELTPGYYTLDDANLIPGEYSFSLGDKLGSEGAARIIDKDGKQKEIVDKNENNKKVKIEKDDKIKVSGNISAKLSIIQ